MISSKCYSQVVHMNQSVLALNNNIGRVLTGIANRLYYSKDKGGKCCENVPQTAGRKVEPWPKNDPPPPMWRSECPQDPQPPNYDPYRIKVPEVAVPPLPPSNAKPMLDCAKVKGPCSPATVPPPPPCPPPPPKPFPWIYVWALLAFFGTFGFMYKMYLWKEEADKVADRPIWRPRRKIKRPFHDKDLPACVQYLIVGTGAAGWAAYRAIMQHDKTAKVFFVTKEDMLPYRRPPMSKWMWWNADPPDIQKLTYVDDERRRKTMFLSECQNYMDPVRFYRKKKGPALSIATGWCVLRVDADEHVAYIKTMAGEQPIYYERCLLAPGSKPKNLEMFKSAPKSVRERVTTLRTIRDLEIAYRKVKESKHVVVIGGGPLGTELAFHLGRMNKVVDREPDTEPIEIVHIYKDKGIMSGLLPEYLGEWAAEKIRCQGVTLMPKLQVYDAFNTADGRLELTLSNGKSVVTDYVFVAVGVEPRVDIAKPSFLEMDSENGGFLVNTELKARTHLYVAGDAASFYSQWKDQRLRIDHYGNAEEQGYIAGANMTGYWIPCNMEPHFAVNLADDLFMEAVGEVGACMPTVGLFKDCNVDTSYFEKGKSSADRRCYKQGGDYEAKYRHGILFYLRDDTVVGFVFWNLKPPIDDRVEVATELLRARPSYKDIDVLADLLGFKDTGCIYKSSSADFVETTCIKKGGDYEAKYRHGILFYLRDDTVVGFVFWNLKPPIDDRVEVATELLRARPSYKDIDVLADLLGFKDTGCIYKSSSADFVETTCIKNRKEF